MRLCRSALRYTRIHFDFQNILLSPVFFHLFPFVPAVAFCYASDDPHLLLNVCIKYACVYINRDIYTRYTNTSTYRNILNAWDTCVYWFHSHSLESCITSAWFYRDVHLSPPWNSWDANTEHFWESSQASLFITLNFKTILYYLGIPSCYLLCKPESPLRSIFQFVINIELLQQWGFGKRRVIRTSDSRKLEL